MKQPAGKFTMDMFGAKRHGRPPTLAPKSNVQTQREFRQRPVQLLQYRGAERKIECREVT